MKKFLKLSFIVVATLILFAAVAIVIEETKSSSRTEKVMYINGTDTGYTYIDSSFSDSTVIHHKYTEKEMNDMMKGQFYGLTKEQIDSMEKSWYIQDSLYYDSIKGRLK